MTETSSSTTISTRLERIAKLAKQIANDGVHDARSPHRHRLAARGVPAHAQEMVQRASTDKRPSSTRRSWRRTSQSLLERAKSGTYRAPPVRRVTSRKATAKGNDRSASQPSRTRSCSGRSRWSLEAVYEQDFWTARTASARALGAPSAERSAQRGDGDRRVGGSWRSTSKVFRHPGSRPSQAAASTNGYATECFCV